MRNYVLVTAALGALLGPVSAIGTLSVVAGVEPGTVQVSGTVPDAHQLQAAVYATFSPDVPAVLLSRRPLQTDDQGRFSTTLSIAPAYFHGTMITVVVQTVSAVALAQGTAIVGDPIVPHQKQ